MSFGLIVGILLLAAAGAGAYYFVTRDVDGHEAWGEARTLVTDSVTALRGGELKDWENDDIADVSLGEFIRNNVEFDDNQGEFAFPEPLTNAATRVGGAVKTRYAGMRHR